MERMVDRGAKSEQRITFEEVMNEIADKGKVFLAGDTVCISKVLSHYLMDIPVYKIIVQAGIHTSEEVYTLEEFDLLTIADSDFCRCHMCGSFPKYNYWTAEEEFISRKEKMCFCSFHCISDYIMQLSERLKDDVFREDFQQVSIEYVTPDEYGNGPGTTEKEIEEKMNCLALLCEQYLNNKG